MSPRTVSLQGPLARLCVSAASAFLLLSVLIVAAAQELHLPAELYDNAGGQWAVEVLSTCRPPLYGSVTLENTTARIAWQVETAPEVLLIGESTRTALSMAALAPFVTKENHRQLAYTICEEEDNYLPTPKRPSSVTGMTNTYLRGYTGVLSSSTGRVRCDSTGERNVVITALGAPFRPHDDKTWRMHEALQVIEIFIETKGLEGACVATSGADTAGVSTPSVEATLESRRRHRKRRAHRGIGLDASTFTVEKTVAINGAVTVRLIRQSSMTPPWYVRYYTPLMFATIFIFFRMVHAFSASRAAK